MNVLDHLFSRKAEISEILARYGASNLRVFGSVARREERADSDIDLLVVLPPGATLFDLCGLQNDLEDLLVKKIDLGTDVRDSLRERVHAEAIRIV